MNLFSNIKLSILYNLLLYYYFYHYYIIIIIYRVYYIRSDDLGARADDM
jgi:hypothetical protein